MSFTGWLGRRFPPSETLSAEESERALAWWRRSGLGIQMMDTLTVGAFMTAFALELGASNLYIGILAAMPHLAQIGQVAGVYVADRWRNRRASTVLFTGLSRPMYLVMAAAAFVPSPGAALALLMGAFALRYATTSLNSCAWNSWVRDLVPEARRGQLTGGRLAAMTALSIVLGLAAGAFVDLWRARGLGAPTTVYGLLLGAAFVGGAWSTWCMARMAEPRMVAPSGDLALLARLRRPWHDENYRRLLAFLGSWNFAINLAAPFFMVHMLKRLGLELSIVVGLTIVSQLVNVAVLRHWGAIADRLSNKAVLQVCAPLFVGCIFAWTFTTFPERHALTVPLLAVIHVLTGVATAGVTLASGNIAMKLAPRGDATAYLASNSLVISIASGIAPVVGGLLADFFTERELALSLHWRSPGGGLDVDTLSISHWDFFFASAAVLGLLALTRLARVREVGHVEEGVVLSEIYLEARRLVQNLSSIAGLRQASEFPFGRFEDRPGARRRKGRP